jgi:hypothetical protein
MLPAPMPDSPAASVAASPPDEVPTGCASLSTPGYRPAAARFVPDSPDSVGTWDQRFESPFLHPPFQILFCRPELHRLEGSGRRVEFRFPRSLVETNRQIALWPCPDRAGFPSLIKAVLRAAFRGFASGWSRCPARPRAASEPGKRSDPFPIPLRKGPPRPSKAVRLNPARRVAGSPQPKKVDSLMKDLRASRRRAPNLSHQMLIIYRPIDQLKPDPSNPRRHSDRLLSPGRFSLCRLMEIGLCRGSRANPSLKVGFADKGRFRRVYRRLRKRKEGVLSSYRQQFGFCRAAAAPQSLC